MSVNSDTVLEIPLTLCTGLAKTLKPHAIIFPLKKIELEEKNLETLLSLCIIVIIEKKSLTKRSIKPLLLCDILKTLIKTLPLSFHVKLRKF